MKNTAPLNTVETVFSKDAVQSLESIMYDYWNEFDHDCFTDKIMSMFAVYIKHRPDNVHMFKKPDWMAKIVSYLIQLNEQFCVIIRDEHTCNWVDTKDGWRLPMSETER